MRFNKLTVAVLLLTALTLVLTQCRGRGTGSDSDLATGVLFFSGLVTDAATGDPVGDAIVTINGPTQKTTNTTLTGTYDFAQLPEGTYSVTASKGGYIPLTKPIELVESPATEPELNFVLSEGLLEGEWRFVLSWGEEPLDVDAHMWSGDDHVYWADPGSEVADPFIFLDVDDRISYGPETITIKSLDSLCQYAVHNFSGSPALTASHAHVDIYSEGALIAAYDVPTSGTGDWWYVCDLDTIGQITLQNTIGTVPPATPPSPGPKSPLE